MGEVEPLGPKPEPLAGEVSWLQVKHTFIHMPFHAGEECHVSRSSPPSPTGLRRADPSAAGDGADARSPSPSATARHAAAGLEEWRHLRSPSPSPERRWGCWSWSSKIPCGDGAVWGPGVPGLIVPRWPPPAFPPRPLGSAPVAERSDLPPPPLHDLTEDWSTCSGSSPPPGSAPRRSGSPWSSCSSSDDDGEEEADADRAAGGPRHAGAPPPHGDGSAKMRCCSWTPAKTQLPESPTSTASSSSSEAAGEEAAAHPALRPGPFAAAPPPGDLWRDPHAMATVARLVTMVETRCGFLRIVGHGLAPESCDRARGRGCVAALRFFVEGLPGAKRARWLQPLQRAVLAATRASEPLLSVRCGSLYVPIPARRPPEASFTRSRVMPPKRQALHEFYAGRQDLPSADEALVSKVLTLAGYDARASLRSVVADVERWGSRRFMAGLPGGLGPETGAALARFVPRLQAEASLRIDFAAARKLRLPGAPSEAEADPHWEGFG